ncbi:MAG: M23 family metallopeptidase [bacterium]|nr:M23 family metallopeptidase [bacterium]
MRRFLLISILCVGAFGCSLFFSGTEQYLSYTIKPGDSLSRIGANFGSSYEELAQINNLASSDFLIVGQEIKIPYKENYYLDSDSTSKETSKEASLGIGRKNYQVGRTELGQASLYKGKLVWPVPGAKLNSGFGRRWFKFHEGLDLAAPVGTRIYAAHAGQIVYSGSGFSGYGNLIAIKGDFGLTTIYGHNYKNLVRRGQFVKQGALIGYVGKTGHATGPHLHFETRIVRPGKGLVAVDPKYFFKK